MPEALPIVELREGGDVRAAVVLPETGPRLRLLLPTGREMQVPRARVVHDTGDTVSGANPAALAAALGSWERRAEALAADVDVAALHDLLAEQGDTGSPLGLADLAGLALGDDQGLARAAVHRALARATAWFRFTGDRWVPRPQEEVEAELEKKRRAEQLERERAAFVAAARARLGGGTEPLPDGSAKFLRALRDVVLQGEASKMRKEATAVVSELEQRPGAATVTDEHAFDLLVALGDMSRDENLAFLRTGIAPEFAPEVLAAAAEAAQRGPGPGRRDLTALEVVTIDDATTTEIDDGLSLETTPRGFRLGIHIADAAHFVDAGSPLDADAEARATSYYLPERVVKMLPPVLAEGSASLNAGEPRPALSFFAEVTPHGELVGFEVQETLVRVARRMTYEDCEATLRGEDGPEWLRTVDAMAQGFEAERLVNGATPIRAPEVSITFDEHGEPLIELIDPGRPARRLVAELMVLANRLVAAWCRDRGLPAIYRRQARPTGAVPPPPRDRMDPVAAFEFRKTLQRTEVGLEPGPHAGLGVECYLQATSPIRRYQDLVQHRILKAALNGRPLPYSREQLQAVAYATEQAGRQARSVEHETDRYWTLRALEGRLGDVLEVVVLRAEDRHSLVQLLEYAYVTPLASRPDHEKGRVLRVRVKASRPRRGTVLLEELHGPEAV